MNILKNSVLKLQYHQEYQYLKLIKKILYNGTKEVGRNGTTLSIMGAQMNFDLTSNTIPLLTTKKIAWRTCLKELLWFIKGDTNNKNLQKQNVGIWNKNGSRKFLDSQGLNHLLEDDLGPIYGHQWRHFNAKYNDCYTNYDNKGIDQLQNVIDQLSNKETRNSRRIIMSAWNPVQINEMALPPCHVLSQYIVKGDELTTLLYQRSGDVGFGIPFNIASYSFLSHILAKHCNLKPKEFIHFIGDAHIYEEHKDALDEQLKREPYNFPKIRIQKKMENIEDYSMDHIQILDYKYYEKIYMNMKE